ncbi:MAG: type IV pilus biogenesis/stability protein PilW [Methylococcales bacterium]
MLNSVLIFVLAFSLSACSLFGADGIKSESSGDVYLQLGVRYLSLNKLEIAKENLELALKNNSDNLEAHIAIAFLYEKIGRFSEARDHYETAVSLAPADLSVQNNYGRFLCDRKEFDKGLSLLNQASSNALNDKQWMALTNAGRCQLGMGQKGKAESYFRVALQANNSYAPALQEMQKISFQKGDFWAAKGFLQRYLNVGEHTAETLLVAVETERSLGNIEIAKEYHKLLIEKFPLSDEAKQLGPVPQY